MNIRKATIDDIESLIKLRIDYLRDDTGLTEEEASIIKSQLKTYFPNHINRDFIAAFAEIDNEVVSAAYLAISEKPANPYFITGKTGTLLNVFTYPEYRRKGLATKVVSLIIDEAVKLDVSSIDLSASPDGKPLYEKLGFTAGRSDYTPMRLKLK